MPDEKNVVVVGELLIQALDVAANGTGPNREADQSRATNGYGAWMRRSGGHAPDTSAQECHTGCTHPF